MAHYPINEKKSLFIQKAIWKGLGDSNCLKNLNVERLFVYESSEYSPHGFDKINSYVQYMYRCIIIFTCLNNKMKIVKGVD